MRTWGTVAAAGPAHSRRLTISPADTAASSAWALPSSCSSLLSSIATPPYRQVTFLYIPPLPFSLMDSSFLIYVCMCVHMCFFRGTHLCVCLYVGQRSSSVTLSFFFITLCMWVFCLCMSAYCTHACLVPAKRTLALLELELQL